MRAQLGATGLADYHALRGELDGRSARLRLYAFDLLMLDGGGSIYSLVILNRQNVLVHAKKVFGIV